MLYIDENLFSMGRWRYFFIEIISKNFPKWDLCVELA